MVTYLSPFIPGLSKLIAPLHELLRKDAEFSWDASYQTAFQHVKDAVVSDTTLGYFDASCPITVEVDASQVRLGAASLHDNKPVAFTSKALTEVECQYANIEHEMLAVVFGAEQFRTSVYGRPFTIESDHRPLESITKKSLADTPSQLQHMLLCLQGYDYVLCFHPGKEMGLPDTLSCFKPKPGPDIALDIAVHHAHLSPVQKEALQLAFEMDVKMHTQADIIISAWPNDIKEVPCPLHPYWQHSESLTVEHGLVFHEEALTIPPSEREKALGTLHQSLHSITKTQLLACGCVFWHGINKTIEKDVWQCETCMRFQAQNVATPLTPTPTPSHPWQICASDIFTLNDADYLILSDFFSKVILVCNLPAGQSNSAKVIHILEEWFVIMVCQKSYPQIMAHNMIVLPLQIAALNSISPMKSPVCTTHSPMHLLSHVSK